MKFLVFGDLHGRKPVVKFKDFDAVILVGDVCEDREIAPLYQNFLGLLKELEEGREISFDEFLLGILQGGDSMEDFEKRSLQKGNEILRYLDTFNRPMFMVAGNWDQSYGPTRVKDMNKSTYNYLKTFFDWWMGERLNPKLIDGVKNVRNCIFSNIEWGGFNIVGYGHTSAPEELSKKREGLTKKQKEKLEFAYDKLKSKLNTAYEKRKNKKLPTIFITHNVPYNTKLDIARKSGSYVYGKHMGSTVAREFCEKYQPLICVGGHIHENPGKVKIKKTLAINAGYGPNAQVLIDIDEKIGKIKEVRF